MIPLDWYRWLCAWRRILWVHLLTWWACRPLRHFGQQNADLVEILRDTIAKWEPDTEIIPADNQHRCEECGNSGEPLVFTNANSPRPHDFLCAACWLDRLIAETKK
jgi:hypothetical protein